jgi:hypothetical protein
MKGIRTQAAEAIAGGAVESAGAIAEERRLTLLRRIALGGGSVAPSAAPDADYGYAYTSLGDDVERDLGILARRGYLEQRFFERVSLCPKCDSHRLNVREICPGCRRSHLRVEGLLHHFRCGYVGIPAEFAQARDGGYVCPKCNGNMDHLGTQYDRFGRAFLCRGCGVIAENPPVEAVCFSCAEHTPAERLVSTEISSFHLTSRGAAAIRRGALLDDHDAPVAIADAPVYQRTVTLEFLDHQLKCLQEFKTVFSLLLAECAAPAQDQRGDDSRAQWLTRLRGAIRPVDVLGQLADARFAVILPQTRRRAAEALCQRIKAALGPRSPFTLTTVEITAPAQLTQLVAGRNTLSRTP